jgi:hypothetical protein
MVVLVSNPIPFSGSTVLLDVTLRRQGDRRRWVIVSRDVGWDCRVIGPQFVSVSGCETREAAEAKKLDWEADISVARADGWK